MSIAPVTCSVNVKAPPPRAFEFFVENMGAWWPRGRTPAAKPHAALVIESKKNGRWFERDAEGHETQWGTVIEWEPPRRLVLGWQLNPQFRYDAKVLMPVEILFDALPDGGTRVSLEHRGLEQLGADAAAFAAKVGAGWPDRMSDFARYTAATRDAQEGTLTMTDNATRPPLPPFDLQAATQKVRLAENAWNTREPKRVALAYTADSRWRNRTEFLAGRAAIEAFLARKWSRELDYRLIKELWAFGENRIAVRFAYEWHDDGGNWFRSYGNENWEFDSAGLMRLRIASINDLAIAPGDRKYHWPQGPRPDDHPALSALGL